MDAMAAAAEDVFDIESFNLDDFDFDLAVDEFSDAYTAFVADKSGCGAAATGGWLAGSDDSLDGSWEEESSGSPDSGVTDGPLAGGEGQNTLSAFVCELEQFLLENNDVVVDQVDAEGAEEEELISVDEYFGDLFPAFDFDLARVAAAEQDADAGKNAVDEGKRLDAREDDETTSRKRARHKIRGTTVTTCSWGELEVTRRHLAPLQVPTLWLPAALALRCA